MKIFFSFYFLLFLSTGVHSFENTKIKIGNFLINKYEITIQEFQAYADTNNYKTLAELNGGGYEWGAGWEKRNGWNFRTPYGSTPESLLEPAVHINRFEAEQIVNLLMEGFQLLMSGLKLLTNNYFRQKNLKLTKFTPIQAELKQNL